MSRRPARTTSSPSSASPPPARSRPSPVAAPLRPWPWVPLYLALFTAAAFLPTLANGFVNWDDDVNLLYNTAYRGLGDAQVRWALTTFHMGHYIPITWMSFGLDYLLWDMRPVGYHLTNLLLHVANVVVFYFVALRLLRVARPRPQRDLGLPLGAAVAALFFGIHPLRVESVAWATERRDVLCGLFYLLAILVYLRACEKTPAGSVYGQANYWASLALFALALLSKAMAVSLPAVLLALDVYPLRRLGQGPGGWLGASAVRIWLEKLPFAILSLAASVVALVALDTVREARPSVVLDVPARIAISLYSLAFYLEKTVLPFRLAPLYELPARVDPWDRPYVLAALVVVAVTAAAIALRRRFPALLAVWATYVVILLPVVGIVHNGRQIAADRYTYLAGFGWALLVGATIRRWAEGRTGHPAGNRRAIAGGGLGIVAFAGLGALTFAQSATWRDSQTLWTHALAVAPSTLGYNNLGAFLAARGDFAEAARQYRHALAIKPDYLDARNNLGVALAKQGRLEDATAAFTEALTIKPDFAEAHYNLGRVLAQQGRAGEAIEHYRRAVAIKPQYRDARLSLERALADVGAQR